MNSDKGSSHKPSPAERTERQACILKYWKGIELFSPQKIPRVNPNSRQLPVFRAAGETPLPWDGSGWFPAAEPGFTWRFTAYCGVYKLARMRALLEKHFGRDRSNFDRRSDGEGCVFALQITGDGRPLLDTFLLASGAWAAGRLNKPGPSDATWLNGFEAAGREEALRFAERFAILENDEVGRKLNTVPGVHVGRPIQPQDLEGEVTRIAAALSISRALNPEQVRLAAVQIIEKSSLEAGFDDFLNSFFLRDLDGLAEEAAHSNLSRSLALYLTADDQVNEDARSDVRTSSDDLWRNTSPQLFPAGRWPAPSHQSLYFSQQFAVNSALDDKANSPLFGVNGPPGTGKTTLLRDVIASVVVERAKVLCKLERPELAFARNPDRWQTSDFKRTIYLWREDLLAFGIVVASSNNRAVENVTLEIPAKRAIAEEYLAKIDYFADFASRILKQRKRTANERESGEAWGLISARLGSKKNRRKFVSNFWFADKEAPEPPSRAEKGFLAYLKSIEPEPASWKKAVASFEEALRHEGAIRKERMDAFAAVETRTRIIEAMNAIRRKLRIAEVSLAETRLQAIASQGLQAECKNKVDKAQSARRSHGEFKPGLVDAVFTLGEAYRDWRKKDFAFAAASETEQENYDRIQAECREWQQQLIGIEGRIAKLAEELANEKARLTAQDHLLDVLTEKLGPAFPQVDRWLAHPDERELSAPWADEDWNRARTKVFAEALHLHRTFIECLPNKVRSNLSGAMDILSGKVSPGVNARTLESAWATLFFVVPVISTTFASFDRLFAHCGREAIGWLLIDEAGQAVPQAAAGALWRSKRAIAVGDPRQLKPIVTLPFTAQQALRVYFGVEETWLPSRNSVQSLVDRASQFGTWLHSEISDEALWVGAPLRAHRRCENPMFLISNRIAYDGQMVYDTVESPSPLPRSCWIDVPASESENHWIPLEGLALNLLLQELFALGIPGSNILLISPFRAVARRLKEIGEQRGIAQAGTIHVSQGKESDIVILVLGGDPERLGAKEWASEEPNLLNVAVSRAKRRLYIIGNREEWRQYPYFSDAASLLTPEASASALTKRMSTGT